MLVCRSSVCRCCRLSRRGKRAGGTANGKRPGQKEKVAWGGEKKERVCLLRKSLKASVCVRVTESLRGHDSSLSRAREEVG